MSPFTSTTKQSLAIFTVFFMAALMGCGGNPAPDTTIPIGGIVIAEDQLAIHPINLFVDVITSLEAPGTGAGGYDTGVVGTDTWEIEVDTTSSIGFGVLNVPAVKLRLLSPSGTEIASVRSGESHETVPVAAGRYRVEVVNEGTESRFTRVGWFDRADGRAEFQPGLYADASFSPSVNRVVALRPLLGAIYKPTPSDYEAKNGGKPGSGSPYEDSDFCNDDFKDSWGPTGRDDIGKLKAAGVNFLHFYDWQDPNWTSGPNGFNRHHRNFLDYCAASGINYAVPISNYAVTTQNVTLIRNIVSEVYDNKKRLPGLIMWQIGNEFDANNYNPAVIAQAAKKVADVEDELGILPSERPAMTSPLAFGLHGNSIPALAKFNELKDAFQQAGLMDLWNSRWIVSVNTFNDGPFIHNWIPQFQQAINIPFCLFELGKEIGGGGGPDYSPAKGDVHDDDQQGAWYQTQLNSVLPYTKDSASLYLGQCMFSFVNEAWKKGTESRFGIYTLGPSTGAEGTFDKNGWTYPLDNIQEKPNFTVMRNAYLAARSGL